MMKLTTVCLVLFASCAYSQQTALPNESRQAVVARLDEPLSTYVPKTKMTYTPDQRELALGSAAVVQDIYSVTYGGIEFRLRVDYHEDARDSRLHPVERVMRTVLTPDKNLHPSELMELLPSTSSVCSTRCTMLGVNYGTEYYLYVYPANPSQIEMEMAADAARGFSLEPSYSNPISNWRWRPGLTFKFIEKPPSTKGPLPLFDSLHVDTIEEGAIDPDFEKRMAHDYK